MASHSDKKIVLITGCSSGFGLYSAARLSTGPYTVYATMRAVAKKSDLLAEVKRRGGTVHVLQLDVTDSASIQTAVGAIHEESGRIDVLINNAGYGVGGYFEDLSEDDIRRQMEVNFFGVQNVTRAVVPLMRRQGAGKIITISSISGLYASPCFGAYNASKWALEGFSESLRYELEPFGIRVLLVEPGVYRTKIFEENARYARGFFNPESPYYRRSQYLHTRMQEMVAACTKDPDEVARLIERLIEARNPPFRTIPDTKSRTIYALRRLLPFCIFSRIIRRAMFAGYQKDSVEKK